MAKAKKQGIKKSVFQEELLCKLDNFEIEEKREELEKISIQLADLEAKRTAAIKVLNDEKTKLTIQHEQLVDILRTKSEKRMVECVEEKNFDTNRAVVIRQDTDEIVRERALDGDERAALAQGELPVTENGVDPEVRA